MDSEDKKKLSEADTKAKFITPAIIESGWSEKNQIRREVYLTPGPIIVRGNLSARNTKKRLYADYVLSFKKNLSVAVVEAKANKFAVDKGMKQAKEYAEVLEVPSAFSSNGNAFAAQYQIPNQDQPVAAEFPMDSFPTPDELWERYKQVRGIDELQEQLILEPYHDDGSGKEPRYYQIEAINNVIEKVARGENRALLVMATGTGKTYTTFQIIYRLWQAKKAKRVLFLVDRNVLADQTKTNDFKPFGSVVTKISNRKIDPSYEIYLGLYQAMTGPKDKDKIFKSVSRNFFDLIVIDECHRGSAKDDSAWRDILEYFENAIQLGLTATPKETEYASNISYFGPPVYTYTLKQGIQDGFLAPYKVIKINIDKDVEGWTPTIGMVDDLGNEIEERVYTQADMDRILVLNHRTKIVAKRVMKFLKATNLYHKTIIFCEDVDHAHRMRNAIKLQATELGITHKKYVMRITGDDKEGKAEIDSFIDKESKYPVIATTSELLSTGVDTKTCQLIVLDKTISSMTTFKQIIGRGTRIEEEYGKYFFTIMDFKKATDLFHDPDFDGEPVVVYEPDDDDDPVPPDPEPQDDEEIEDDDDDSDENTGDDEDEGKGGGRRKFYVSNVPTRILSEQEKYLDEEGRLVTETYRDYSRHRIQEEFASLKDFLTKWESSKRKAAIVDLLAESGIILEQLAEDVGKDYDDFDLICHIAYDQPPLTRKERAANVKKHNYFTKYESQARAVLEALLDKYADSGLTSIEDPKVLKLNPFNKIGTPVEIIKDVFGGKDKYQQALDELEQALFKKTS